MSIFDVIKKIFEEEKQEEIKIESIGLHELSSKLDKEIKNLEGVKQKLKTDIIKEFSDFKLKIEGNIKILENFNLDKRKEEEKLKLTVMENLKVYINFLRRFLDDINSIENIYPEEYLKKSNDIINNFKNISRNSFEKATILIGKELGNAKDTINDFISKYNEISNRYPGLFVKIENIKKIKNLLEELNNLSSANNEIEESTKKLRLTIEDIKKQETDSEKEIERIKNSKAYQETLNEKEKYKKDLQEAENELQKLKEKIDLKFLAKYFHEDKKKSELIQKYQDNFKNALDSDLKYDIILLVKEAKSIDIQGIMGLKTRIDNLAKPIISSLEKGVLDMDDKIKKLKSESEDKFREILENDKKKEKLEEKKKDIIQEVRHQAKYLNIEIK